MPPLSPPRPLVYSLHCMSQFMRPDLYPWYIRWRLNALTRLGIRQADLVLCVSEQVRDFACEQFDLSRERTAVVYNGLDKIFAPVEDDALLRESLRE